MFLSGLPVVREESTKQSVKVRHSSDERVGV